MCIEETMVLYDSAGNPVRTIVSIPTDARAVVVMSHGFTSSGDSGLYKEFQGEFNRLSIGTVRYDYYGHGPLYGHTSGYAVSADVTLTKAVASLNAVIAYLRGIGQYHIALLGASFGGLVSLVVAAQDPTVERLILKSPVTEPIRFWQERLGNTQIREWQEQGTLHDNHDIVEYDLSYDYWVDLQSYDTMRMSAGIRCSTLIIHGEKDTCVPIDQSRRLAAVLGTEVQVVIGAEHSYAEPDQQAEMKRLITESVRQWAEAD